jgi:hypothetical protein
LSVVSKIPFLSAGPIAIANAIRDNKALTKLDISKNRIGLLVHPEWRDLAQSGTWGGHRYQHIDGQKQETKPEGIHFKPLGITALTDAIKDMRALSTLVMRQNDIHGAEAGRAFADMLAQNTVLKELDLSSQKVGRSGKALDAAFAKEFAVGISGNGAKALSVLNLADNNIGSIIGGYSEGIDFVLSCLLHIYVVHWIRF